ncbi:hypothetical protein [uncultured Muriicola sp.]|nr:hypothetical protein [uncultured Muriicola sp.]
MKNQGAFLLEAIEVNFEFANKRKDLIAQQYELLCKATIKAASDPLKF